MLKFRRHYDQLEPYFNTLRFFCTTSTRSLPKNYYEILNLNSDCTSKEVRDAFIKLSKQMHPDKNFNDLQNHQRFVKLNEAYSVLSRPQKRYAYDLNLRNNQQFKRVETSHRTRQSRQNSSTYFDPNEYYHFWNPKHTKGETNGTKRLSKSWIVFLSLMFASTGVGLQILAIRKSQTFSREKLDRMTEENSRILADVHRQASENGYGKQLELIKHKIEESVDQYNQRKRMDK